MKLFNAIQLKAWDKQSIQEEQIEFQDLINRAARACIEPIVAHLNEHNFRQVLVFCGPGNNGKDGLAIAKLLADRQIRVSVFCDSSLNAALQVLAELNPIVQAYFSIEQTELPSIESNSLLIDALFGAGLNRPLNGYYASLVQQINQANLQVISIDLPSGLSVDLSPQLFQQDLVCIKATQTLSFQQPKQVFFFEELAPFVGNWMVLPIGLSVAYEQQTNSLIRFQDEASKPAISWKEFKFGHKGLYGHLGLFAGSKGMAGAALLAGKAAMRTGLGLLTFHVSESLLSILQIGLPEAMANTDNMNDLMSHEAIKNKYQTIAIGPGMGKNEQSLQLLETLISINKKTPFVIDADAIHLCALLKQKNPNWQFPELAVLTPHPKELKSLVGDCSNSFEQLENAKQFASENKVIIVLKGAYTRIIAPDGQVVYNGTGNALLSTAGSGDVLTGIIGGLLAQGFQPFLAAKYGVWLHGKCAQSLQSKGIQTAIASDIITEISNLI